MATMSQGYMKVMGPIGMSIWNSNQGPPMPVYSPNGAGYFSNEGSGAGVIRSDFSNLGRRMGAFLSRRVTGSKPGAVVTTVCGRVVGEPWHLGGRVAEMVGPGIGNSGVGFLRKSL